MIVRLKRASLFNEKPDDIAYRDKRHDTFLEGWLAEIPSLEWAVDRWNDIIVSKYNVENVKYEVTIYDDYVE